MKLSDFDYSYPEELIATHPLKNRDQSKMMVVKRENCSLEDRHITDFTSFLRRGDLIILNDTKVFPARLIGKKESGGKVEILLLSPPNPPLEKGGEGGFGVWRTITNQTARLKIGSRINFGDDLICRIVGRDGEEILVEFDRPELIEKVGLPPIPPYIRKIRRAAYDHITNDKDRYQTIYAKHLGSAAAPTAGLHFTDELLKKIKETGAKIANVTLHVGLDTFSPVREENILEHKMHGEEYSIPQETVNAIADTKKNGGRVIAIGTTSVRALESYCSCDRTIVRSHDRTNLFITPGYKFKTVDAMLTNFHQPKSTLLMLVSAFAGKELIFKAYQEAISQKYRLFSYGDCMLII